MKDILNELDTIGAETDDAIDRFLGDEEMYLKYVWDFPQEPTMGRLTAAVAVKDYEQSEKSVHALKGIANNLGFIPLADAAIDMLAELRDGNMEEAMDAYEDVETAYQKFCSVINGCK